MIAVWCGSPHYTWYQRASRFDWQTWTDFGQCWKCGKARAGIYTLDAAGALWNEYHHEQGRIA